MRITSELYKLPDEIIAYIFTFLGHCIYSKDLQSLLYQIHLPSKVEEMIKQMLRCDCFKIKKDFKDVFLRDYMRNIDAFGCKTHNILTHNIPLRTDHIEKLRNKILETKREWINTTRGREDIQVNGLSLEQQYKQLKNKRLSLTFDSIGECEEFHHNISGVNKWKGQLKNISLMGWGRGEEILTCWIRVDLQAYLQIEAGYNMDDFALTRFNVEGWSASGRRAVRWFSNPYNAWSLSIAIASLPWTIIPATVYGYVGLWKWVINDLPRKLAPGYPWIKKIDPASGRVFYTNIKTQESVWDERPQVFVPAQPATGIESRWKTC